MPNFKSFGHTVPELWKMPKFVYVKCISRVLKVQYDFSKQTLKHVSNYFAWPTFCAKNRAENPLFWQHCRVKVLRKNVFSSFLATLLSDFLHQRTRPRFWWDTCTIQVGRRSDVPFEN
jgi:hypothetical protein